MSRDQETDLANHLDCLKVKAQVLDSVSSAVVRHLRPGGIPRVTAELLAELLEEQDRTVEEVKVLSRRVGA